MAETSDSVRKWAGQATAVSSDFMAGLVIDAFPFGCGGMTGETTSRVRTADADSVIGPGTRKARAMAGQWVAVGGARSAPGDCCRVRLRVSVSHLRLLCFTQRRQPQVTAQSLSVRSSHNSSDRQLLQSRAQRRPKRS